MFAIYRRLVDNGYMMTNEQKTELAMQRKLDDIEAEILWIEIEISERETSGLRRSVLVMDLHDFRNQADFLKASLKAMRKGTK